MTVDEKIVAVTSHGGVPLTWQNVLASLALIGLAIVALKIVTWLRER